MKKYSIGVFFNLLSKNRKDWDREIDKIKKLSKVGHVEIMLEETRLRRSDIRYLKNLLQNYRIILHAPFLDLTFFPNHTDIAKAVRKVYKKSFAIAESLKAENITLHAESYPFFYSEQRAEKQLIKEWEHLSSLTSIPLSLENLSLGGKTQIPYPSTPKQILKIASKTPITVDAGHLLKDNFDVYNVIEKLNKKIGDIHLHDGAKGFAHAGFGKGNLDLEKLLLVLKKINYEKFLTLEIMDPDELIHSWNLLSRHIREIY